MTDNAVAGNDRPSLIERSLAQPVAVAPQAETDAERVSRVLGTWSSDNFCNSAFSQGSEAWGKLQDSLPGLVEDVVAAGKDVEPAVRNWIMANLANTAFSQNTEAWNALQRSIPNMVEVLTA